MNKTLLQVGGLIQNSDNVIHGPAYIVWANGRVLESGAGTYQGDLDGAEVISRPRHVAMPGLINTHGHAAMTLFRSAGDDVPLQTWLKEKIYPLESKLTADAVYYGSLLAMWEMLISGTTCYTDMYFFMDESARAAAESGMRGVLSLGLLGFTETMQREGLEISERFAAQWNGAADGRISVLLGPHAPYTCPPEFLDKVAALSSKLRIGLQIHLSETRKEIENAKRDFGKTPIAHVEALGLLDRPVLAAHCVHVTDDDLDILRRHDVRVAHNPQSNLKLGSGVAPLVKILNRGITVGLGTDGAASNNNLDMFEEMRLAATLHKGVLEDATAVPAKTAFELATSQGARAVFRPTHDGTLLPNAAADVVLLSLDSPRFFANYDLLSNVVYSASSDDVTDVFIAGRHVVDKGEVKTLDTERIRYEVNRITSGLLKG